MTELLVGGRGLTVGSSREYYRVPLLIVGPSRRGLFGRGRQRLRVACEYDRDQCYRRPARPHNTGARLVVSTEKTSFRSVSPPGRSRRRRVRRKLSGSILDAAVAKHQEHVQHTQRKKLAVVQQEKDLVKFMEDNHLETGKAQLEIFLEAGLSFSNLKKLLELRFQVLEHRPSTIKKKLQFFKETVGMSKEELKKMLIRFPRILEYNTWTTITPRIRFLKRMGLQMEDMPKMFIRAPAVFELSVKKTLMPRMEFLENEAGIARENLRRVIVKHPQMITFSEDYLRERLNFIKSFGLTDDKLAKTIVNHPQILNYSKSGIESRIDYLRSIGVSDSGLPRMISSMPQLLSLNIEVNLAPKVEFLRDELGGCNKTFETNPQVLALSLHKRIIPRYEFMKSVNSIQHPTPMHWFKCSDKVFAGKIAKVPLAEFIAFKESICAA